MSYESSSIFPIEIKNKAEQFKEIFEECSYLIHVLKGDKINAPILSLNVISIEVKYKNFDIYCYEDKFNIYIDEVHLYKLQKINIRSVNEFFHSSESTHITNFYNISFKDVPYNYIQQMKEILILFL